MNSAPRFREGGAAPPVFFRAAAGVCLLVPSRHPGKVRTIPADHFTASARRLRKGGNSGYDLRVYPCFPVQNPGIISPGREAA